MTPTQLTAQTEAVLDFLGGLAMPMKTETEGPTGICPECGAEYFCYESVCESPEHDKECDIDQLEDES